MLPTTKVTLNGLGKKNDALFWDVLTALALSVNTRLQWRENRDTVHKKYEKVYDKETFEAILGRVLRNLLQSGYVRKDIKGHQSVFYFIPKRRRQDVIDELNKRWVHKKLDEIWERLSSEQRKKAVESLVENQGMLIQAEKYLIKTLFQGLRELGEDWLSNLNQPSGTTKKDLSLEEKQSLSNQLQILQNQFVKIETEMANEDAVLKEKWKEYLELSFEFTNKVVDPFYHGNGLEAITDLMRKAIDEQNKK